MVAIATEKDWPHGLRCMDCDDRLLGHGYSKRLVKIWPDGTFVTEIVCVACASGLGWGFGFASPEVEKAEEEF